MRGKLTIRLKRMKGEAERGYMARIIHQDGTYCAMRRFPAKKEAWEWAELQLEDPRLLKKWEGKEES